MDIKGLRQSFINLKKGYGFFPDEDIYDLKYAIARFILPRLKAYIDQLESGNWENVPKKLIKEDNHEQGMKDWIIVLRKISFPFAYLVNKKEFRNLSSNEIDDGLDEGLNLFTEYFFDLWD